MERQKKGEAAKDLMVRGETLLGQGLYDKAISYFDRALSEDAMEYQIYIDKAICLINLDLYQEAGEALQKARMIDKRNPAAWFHLANLSILGGDFVKGAEYYHAALELGHDAAEIYYNLGLLYEEEGDGTRAIRNYSKASLAAPLHPGYRIRRALLHIDLGQYKEALQVLEEQRRYCPDSFEGWHLAAAVFLFQDDAKKAEQIIGRAIALFPEDRELIFDQARIYHVQERYGEALGLLSKLWERAESEGERQRYDMEKGKIYGEQNRMEDCLKIFQDLASEAGEELQGEARFYLMNLYLAWNQFEVVLEQARNLSVKGKDGKYEKAARYYEALALKKMGREKEGEKAYREALAYYRRQTIETPGDLDSCLFRILCHRDLGEGEKAMELLDYVLLLVPDDRNLHGLKAGLYRDLGQEEAYRKEAGIWQGQS